MYSNIFSDVQIEDRRMKKRKIDLIPLGPSERDLEQMAEREIQMAAYLATNPDPVTGLPIRQAQEFPRPLPERDRPSNFNPYDDGPRGNYDLPIFDQLLYADLYRFGY